MKLLLDAFAVTWALVLFWTVFVLGMKIWGAV